MLYLQCVFPLLGFAALFSCCFFRKPLLNNSSYFVTKVIQSKCQWWPFKFNTSKGRVGGFTFLAWLVSLSFAPAHPTPGLVRGWRGRCDISTVLEKGQWVRIPLCQCVAMFDVFAFACLTCGLFFRFIISVQSETSRASVVFSTVSTRV